MKAAFAILALGAFALLTSARELQQYDYAPKATPAPQGYQSPAPQTYQSPAPQTYQSPAPQTYQSPPPYYPPYSYTPAPPAEVQQWQKDALAWVNKYYRWGGKWPLSWDYKLKSSCEAAASEAATKYYYPYSKVSGEYDYNQLPAYGVTAYKFVPSAEYGNKPGWQVAAEYWYSEGAKYNNAYSVQTSNYTQLTWKASTGWWICSAKDQYNSVYYYAHYYAPGNIKGYYSSNVPAYTPVTPPASPAPTTPQASPAPTTPQASPAPTTPEATPAPAAPEATPTPAAPEATPAPTTPDASTAAPETPSATGK